MYAEILDSVLRRKEKRTGVERKCFRIKEAFIAVGLMASP